MLGDAAVAPQSDIGFQEMDYDQGSSSLTTQSPKSSIIIVGEQPQIISNSGDKISKMSRRKQVKPKKKKRTENVIVQLHKKTRGHPPPGLAGLSQRIRNEQTLQKSQR